MNHGQARIVCPRCRANNFPGTPHCFQCGGSLPPPEAVGQPAAAPPNYGRPAAQSPYPQAPFGAQPVPPAYSAVRPNRSAWWVVVPVILVLILVCGGLFVFSLRSRSTARSAGGSDIQAQVDELNRLRREHGLAPSGPAAPTEPTTEQRELSRLREKIYGPGSSSGGSAGSGRPITFGEWQRLHGGDASSYMFH